MAKSKQNRRKQQDDFIGLQNPRDEGDGTEWIFESPDGGKTIYKRAIGTDEKILVRKNENKNDSI